MTKDQLAQVYSMGSLRMHDAVTHAYERMHDPDGEPTESVDRLESIINNLRTTVESEIEFVVTALEERLDATE
mgnify:CR=1 FL=1